MRIHAVLALVLTLGAFGCSDDDGGGITNPGPVANVPDVSGRFTSTTMWLTQFRRTHDGYNGSWTCSGQLTITQAAGSRTLGGFAVVGAPCPAESFELTGTVDPSGAMTINMRGPRPGAGTCPLPPVAAYTGLLDNQVISIRNQVTLSCPGDGEGQYVFNQIVTARQTSY
jgi:hypothetical protein